MATTTPVGYNPSQIPISGTTQIGNLAVGASAQEYSRNPGNIKFWMSPDQDLGYVIAKPIAAGNQPYNNSISATGAYVGFSRSTSLTESSFTGLVNQIAAGATSFSDTQGSQAKTWLENNGYWTSFVSYPANLLVYLDSGNSSSYSGSGSTWTDLVAPTNNATLINTPTYSSSDGGIIQFDDVSLEYATIPNIGNLSQWTVETWVRITGSLSSKVSAIVCNQFDLSTKLNFSIGTNNAPTNRNIAVGFFDGAWRTTAGFVPTLNTWYQIVGTYDGTTIRQYVNGVANGGTLSYSGTPQSGGEVRLMRRWDETLSAGNLIDGDLAIVKIYNSALSSGDILQSFNDNKSRFGL